VEALLPEHIPRVSQKQISNIMWAYAATGRRPPCRILEPLMDAVAFVAKYCEPQGVANIAWAMGHMQQRGEERALLALQDRAAMLFSLARRKPSAAPGGNLSTHRQVGFGQEGTTFNFKPQEVAMFTWGMASLQRLLPTELLGELAQHAAQQADAYNPWELSNFTQSLALLCKKGQQMPDELPLALEAIESAAARKLPAFKPQELSSLMEASATLSRLIGVAKGQASAVRGTPVRGTFVGAVCDRLISDVQDYRPQDLSAVLRSLATVRHLPDAPTVEALASKLAQVREYQLNDRALSGNLWALAQLNMHPGAPVLNGAVEELIRRANDGMLSPTAAHETMWALAVFDALTPQTFSALARGSLVLHKHNRSSGDLHMVFQAAIELPDNAELADTAQRLLEAAREACRTPTESAAGFQSYPHIVKDVSMVLRLLKLPHEKEMTVLFPHGSRVVNLLVRSSEGMDLALQVDGPLCFAANKPRAPLGGTVLRNRQLERAGLRVVSLSTAEWEAAVSLPERQKLLTALLFPGSNQGDAQPQ